MRETGELELASTITLVLQAKRLTKYASHPKDKFESSAAFDLSYTIILFDIILKIAPIHVWRTLPEGVRFSWGAQL